MDRPVRVLHVLQRMEAAGVQTLLMSLYRQIDRSKVQFDFLVHYSTPQFFDEEIERLGGRIYHLTVREDFNFIKYYRQLNRFFQEHKEYKVVHGHMHSLGAIYLHAAKKHGVNTRIAHAHTNASQKDFKQIPKMVMNHLYSRSATELFACSQAAGRYMFGDSEFKVINNAINAEHFAFRAEARQKKRAELGVEKKIVIGSVGRFTLQKNQKFAVEVFEKYHRLNPDSVLLLIGSGDMMDEVKELVHQKKLDDSVMFLGNRRDVAELYQAMDVFLMPSLFEGLGIVGVEAQAAGTPTVCTDTLPEEINVSPLLHRVSLSDAPEKWVKAIEEALQNPYAHTNMESYIREADYDMASLVKELQAFYIEKSR